MNKRYYNLILAICLLLPLFCGCSSDDSSEMNEHPTINDIQFTEQGSKREVLYAIDGSKGLTLDESVRKSVLQPIRLFPVTDSPFQKNLILIIYRHFPITPP